MTEADEDRRKDEDTGKVTTYAELLAEHDYNSELAAVAWDVMTPVSGGTDTPSGAMGGLSLGGDQATQQQQQQAAEIRKYRQQQAAKKEADEAAAKAATQAANKNSDLPSAEEEAALEEELSERHGEAKEDRAAAPKQTDAEILAAADRAATEAVEKEANRSRTAAARAASGATRTGATVLKMGLGGEARLQKADVLKTAMGTRFTTEREKAIASLFGESVSRAEAAELMKIAQETKIAEDRLAKEAHAEAKKQNHIKDAEAHETRKRALAEANQQTAGSLHKEAEEQAKKAKMMTPEERKAKRARLRFKAEADPAVWFRENFKKDDPDASAGAAAAFIVINCENLIELDPLDFVDYIEEVEVEMREPEPEPERDASAAPLAPVR